MGATGISTTFTTHDFVAMVNKIHEESSRRYSGRYCEDAAYSGDWNTVSISKKPIKVLDKYSETKAKAWLKKNMDKEWDSLDKREGKAFDLGVVGYEVWTVKKSLPTDKKTPKYETKFVVYHLGGDFGRTEIVDATEKTATSANNKAVELTLKNDTIYHVKKTRVLISGTEETAKFTIEKKTYKSKPKSVKKGATLREAHKYFVIGMAAC